MTDENRIAHFRRQRADALESIKEMDDGRIRHFDFEDDKPIDTTAEWRAQKHRDVDMLARLIAAWASLNA